MLFAFLSLVVTPQGVASRTKSGRRWDGQLAARIAVETIEPRRLFAAGFVPLAPTSTLAWATGYFASAKTVDLQAGASKAPSVTAGQAASLPRSIAVNGAGLPLLESRPGGQGLPIFIDFTSHPDIDKPFSLDSNTATFNLSEELAIYKCWRRVSSYFAQFNVNVTTVKPGTGSSDPNFAWMLITNNPDAGSAGLGTLGKSGPTGSDSTDDALNRISSIVHELGHILGLGHQSDWSKSGKLTNEYSNGDTRRNVPIMGIDFNGTPNSRWWYGRADFDKGSGVIQDDVQVIANAVAKQVGGDGMRPDDFGNTTRTATILAPGSQQLDGYVERSSDADVFKITSTSSGPWSFSATPLFGSQLRPNLELFDSRGNVVASRNDAAYRNGTTNEQNLNLSLKAGTYCVRVSSGGGYDDLGYYQLAATQLPGTFASGDVGTPLVSGSVTYNATTGLFTQSGGGTDIAGKSDQFRYTYQTLNGNGSITARVDTLDNIDALTKAGVMIRQSLNGNAAQAYIGINPTGTLDTLYRSSAGTNAAMVNNRGIGPWVRLTRTGNVFTYASSADGKTWTTLGTKTIVMTGPVYVGLATCSRDASNAMNEAFATFSQVSITGNATPAATGYNALAAPTNLTASAAPGANTSIDLSWSASRGATGYRIERSVDGITYTTLTTVGSGTTSYRDASVWGSMRWYYRVGAANGTSTFSTPSTAASTVNKPNAPTTTSYTAPAISPNPTDLYLNWLDVQGETGYTVAISTDGKTFQTVATTGANQTSVNLSGLTAGTTYKIRITPLTAIGDGQTASLVYSGTTRSAAFTSGRFVSRSAKEISFA